MESSVPQLARSYLYVPGDQPAKLARALDRGADALIAVSPILSASSWIHR